MARQRNVIKRSPANVCNGKRRVPGVSPRSGRSVRRQYAAKSVTTNREHGFVRSNERINDRVSESVSELVAEWVSVRSERINDRVSESLVD